MVKLKKQKVRFRKKRGHSPQKSSMRFKTAVKFLTAALIVGTVGFGFLKLKYMFVDSDYFVVKGVVVKLYSEDGSFLRKVSLPEIAGENIVGTNIFFMDLNKLREKIENAHPEFKNVILRRLLPNKLVAQANLRKAIAQIRSDRYYFVDKEGVLLPDVKNFPDPALPVITGMGVNLAKIQRSKFSKFEKENIDKALSLIREMQGIEELANYKLKTVDITDPGNLSFFFGDSDIEIKIGNSDFSKRLKVLATVLAQLGSDIDRFRYIDLRFEDPIVGPQ